MNGIALQVLGYADLPKMEGPKDPSRSGTIQMYNSFESILSNKQTDMSKTNAKTNNRDSFPESSQRSITDLRKGKMQYTNAKDINTTRESQGKDAVDQITPNKEKSDLSKPIEKLKKKVEVLKKAIAETSDDALKEELKPILAATQEVIQKLEALENNQTLGLANGTTPASIVGNELADLKSLIETLKTSLSDLKGNQPSNNEQLKVVDSQLNAFEGILEKVESTLTNLSASTNQDSTPTNASHLVEAGPMTSEIKVEIPETASVTTASLSETLETVGMENQSMVAKVEATPVDKTVTTEAQVAVGSKVASDTKVTANESTSSSDQVETLGTIESVTVESTQNGGNEQTTSGNQQGKSNPEEAATVKKENSDQSIKSIDISKHEPSLTKLSRPEHTSPMRKLETNIMSQIQEMMKSSLKIAKNTNGEMTLKLKPESLGQVSLKLVMGADGQMTADFKVENLMVKGILESNMGELKASLIEKGIQVSQFDVSLSDQGQGNKGQHTNQQNHSRGNGSTGNKESEFEKEVLLKQHLNDDETTINSLV